MPEISIIVPVYKVEAYLQTCIDSILAQTFQDFELILVDDGSPDNCPVICDEAARKDPRVRVRHQQNAGISAARNAGLKIAQGNWLGFVDSDDFVAPEFYETLYRAAKKENVKGAVCSSIQVDETGKRIEHYTDLNVSDGVRTSQEIWLDQKQKRFGHLLISFYGIKFIEERFSMIFGFQKGVEVKMFLSKQNCMVAWDDLPVFRNHYIIIGFGKKARCKVRQR